MITLKKFKLLIHLLILCQVAITVVPAFHILTGGTTEYLEIGNKSETEDDKVEDEIKDHHNLHSLEEYETDKLSRCLKYLYDDTLSSHLMEDTTPPPELV